jgi:hypothetical protein
MDAIPARRFSLANASSDSMKLWRFLGINRRGLRPVLGYLRKVILGLAPVMSLRRLALITNLPPASIDVANVPLWLFSRISARFP